MTSVGNGFRKFVTIVGICSSLQTIKLDVVSASEAVAQTPLYGLKKGRLLPCKAKSNCISTSSVTSVEKYSRPWEFTNPPIEEFQQIVKVLEDDPYLKVADKDDSKFYIRAEAKSAVPPTGIDDIELLLNDKDNIITYRSNSRDVVMAGSQVLGDAGSNRNRLDSIKRKLAVKEMGMTEDTEVFLKKNDQLSIFQRISAASQPSDINFVDNSVPEEKN
eukprot:CAMPEP_0170084492 /NCGR_PEP_ID=MMETSP0019_2-20121128/19681_1 /TAXON_ID=98059 /ORGANISM="Dinobryon sp., Strain UTEXLB2267" /LENGTH=217 /DNA_ID=CAMNT_0010300619 /DNA_START=92 /DNA_END=745 /DNA_ORIENTATION=+